MKRKALLYIGNDFSAKSNYKTSQDVLSKYLIQDDYIIYKTSKYRNKILRIFDMCFSILKLKNKVDYILIDTFSSQAFYYAYFTSQIARIIDKKYIMILRGGNLPNRLKKSPKLSNSVFKNSYRNIAPSNYLKSEFEAKGFEVQFIPNILEIENYEYKFRNNLKPKILWVRAFAEIYNPTLAIEVLKSLKIDYPEIKLCMIGPVKESVIFKKTEELVAKYNLQKNIEFTGVLPKEKWIKKSEDFDIFINTTNVDNTPVSVMEAMALGLPVVSTNVGGIPYLLDNGKDALLVKPKNTKAMANAINNILDGNFQDLSKNARIKAESFSWEFVGVDWNRILK